MAIGEGGIESFVNGYPVGEVPAVRFGPIAGGPGGRPERVGSHSADPTRHALNGCRGDGGRDGTLSTKGHGEVRPAIHGYPVIGEPKGVMRGTPVPKRTGEPARIDMTMAL